MNEAQYVSPLMLERYHLGEVSAQEHKRIQALLTAEPELRLRYESLAESEQELRNRYPLENLPAFANIPPGNNAADDTAAPAGRNLHRYRLRGFPRAGTPKIIGGLCAAALLLCAFFPSLHYLREKNSHLASEQEIDGTRLKGHELKHELALYLKETPTHTSIAANADGRRLQDEVLLSEGNTVQLAYTTLPGAEYYGTIFSIDGRSVVTLHYPYHRGQSTLLQAGKRTFLDEAYILDDAPDFEIFFMVISRTMLNIDQVLRAAGKLAQNPQTALAKSAAAFSGCEVETITIYKQGAPK